MELLADGLLMATALTAAIYCAVLSRRLRRLGSSDEGLGARIASLSATVEETRAAVVEARRGLDALKAGSSGASERLKRDMAQALRLNEEIEAATDRASGVLDRLHRLDLPQAGPATSPADGFEIVSVDLPPTDAGRSASPAADAVPAPAAEAPAEPERLFKLERMGL